MRKAMSPLSVLCTLFGLYTVEIKRNKMKSIAAIYGWILTVLFFTSWATSTIIELSGTHYTFITVTWKLGDLVRIIVVTYYCVKYQVEKGAVYNVYNTIDCSDQHIERIEAKVSQKTQQLKCVIYRLLLPLFQ